jgi:hypothetical protein
MSELINFSIPQNKKRKSRQLQSSRNSTAKARLNEDSTEKLNASADGRRLPSAMARQASDVVYRIRDNKIDERLNSKLHFCYKISCLHLL